MSDSEPLPDLEHFERLSSIIQSGECVLFLGAGVSIDSGAPDGEALADELVAKFFPDTLGKTPLDVVAGYVDAEISRRAFIDWLRDRFKLLRPQGALISIPEFRWKSIYTTNFDTLLEQAYSKSESRLQDLRPFYSDRDELSRLRPHEVAYYKLHGCLSRDASASGSLVLTKSDYAKVGAARKKFFNRLLEDMSDYTLFYVGFRHNDPDFWQAMASVEEAAGGLTELRRSYALRRNYSQPESQFWSQKRVTLIDSRAREFFESLGTRLPEGRRYVDPLAGSHVQRIALLERKPKVTMDVIHDIERNFELVDERVKQIEPNIGEFFAGAPPNWGAVALAVDAERDLKDDLLAGVLEDPHLDRRGPQLVVLHAEAGAGKTTLLRRTAVDLALLWGRVVVSLNPQGTLEYLSIERLTTAADERVFVIVDDAAGIARELSRFLGEALKSNAKVTVLAAARSNEWNEVKFENFFPSLDEVELERLSRSEIEAVLDTLRRHDALGLLAGTSRETQILEFETRADKQLLVALREATEGKNFDEIIVDEFEGIPTLDGQRAYLLVSALHRLGIQTRAGLLHRALGVALNQLADRVLHPTQKIIIEHESLGGEDVSYSTRHQLIADIVFDRKIPSERRRLEFYSDIIVNLDLGYASDASAYRRLTRGANKQLLRSFVDADNRRELMRLLIEVDPEDAFVHQHAAMLELEERNLSEAARHLGRAIDLFPTNTSIRDTEGRLIATLAMLEENPLVAEQQFAKAEEVYLRNIDRKPDEPFAYRHLAETYVNWSKRMPDDRRKIHYLELAYATLLKGLDRCASVSMLLQYQAELERDYLGNASKAREILGAIVEQNPANLVARFMAARLDQQAGRPLAALELLREGLQHNALEAKLHARIAELMVEIDFSNDQVLRRHFEAALLGPQRNYRPRLMYGAYLFSRGEFGRADEQFGMVDSLFLSPDERAKVETFRFGGLDARQTGRVTRLSYGFSGVEYAGGAVDIYFSFRRLHPNVAKRLVVGTRVGFRLGFNTRGAIAYDVRPVN